MSRDPQVKDSRAAAGPGPGAAETSSARAILVARALFGSPLAVHDTDPIRSAQNPLVQRVRALRRGTQRAGTGSTLLLEGDRLVDDALRAGLAPEVVLIGAERAERARELAARGVAVRLVDDSLLADLSSLRSGPGCLALVPEPAPRGVELLSRSGDALVVVAAGLQDPGNLGALARACEAAGVAALVVTGGGCRPWNEKALRGSMGSLLRLPVLELAAPGEAIAALEAAGHRSVFARTRGGADPERFDWAGRVALWVASETGRMPDEVERLAQRSSGVTIPMEGEVESLNVTAAAAVLLFAARRARLGAASGSGGRA
jgi:TrmH family RNA methyltransferase